VDARRTADGHELSLRAVDGRRHERPEHGELLPDAHVVSLAELDVDDVAFVEEHLIERASDELAPGVLLGIVDPADVARDHRVGWNGAASAAPSPEPRAADAASAAWPAAAFAQTQLIARVDPVRVLDLGVVRPEPRPVVGVAVVAPRDVPKR